MLQRLKADPALRDIPVLMISALMAAVVLLLIKPFSTRLEKLSGAESLRQGMLIESIHGMRTIKSLALEPKQRKVWEQRTANSIHLHFDVMGISLTAQALSLLELLKRLESVRLNGVLMLITAMLFR